MREVEEEVEGLRAAVEAAEGQAAEARRRAEEAEATAAAGMSMACYKMRRANLPIVCMKGVHEHSLLTPQG